MSHSPGDGSHSPGERQRGPDGGSDPARLAIKCPGWREIRTVVAGELAGQQTAAGKVNIDKFIFILFFSNPAYYFLDDF